MNLTPYYSISRAVVHIQRRYKKLDLPELLKVVSFFTMVPIPSIKHQTRVEEIVEARHIFCYLAWFYTSYPLREISSHIDRHYSSAITARNKIDSLLSYDKNLQNTVNKIETLIKTNYKQQKRA